MAISLVASNELVEVSHLEMITVLSIHQSKGVSINKAIEIHQTYGIDINSLINKGLLQKYHDQYIGEMIVLTGNAIQHCDRFLTFYKPTGN